MYGLYFTFDPGLTVTVNFVFLLRGSPMSISLMIPFLGYLAIFICSCVTVLLYHYLYFVVNKNKNVYGGKETMETDLHEVSP